MKYKYTKHSCLVLYGKVNSIFFFNFSLPKLNPCFAKRTKKRMDSWLQKSGYALLCPAPPPLSLTRTQPLVIKL